MDCCTSITYRSLNSFAQCFYKFGCCEHDKRAIDRRRRALSEKKPTPLMTERYKRKQTFTVSPGDFADDDDASVFSDSNSINLAPMSASSSRASSQASRRSNLDSLTQRLLEED